MMKNSIIEFFFQALMATKNTDIYNDYSSIRIYPHPFCCFLISFPGFLFSWFPYVLFFLRVIRLIRVIRGSLLEVDDCRTDRFPLYSHA